jgi:pyruvate/2-oxoacid:ferredoxin oxidoreductase alpha subunit
MAHAVEESPLYGVMAEFDTVQGVVDAAKQAVAAGYIKLEAYTPFPVEELNDVIHVERT